MNDRSARHYLVTGGLGFIGSHLVDALLSAGHRVSVIDDLSTGKRDNVSGPVTVHIGCVTDGALMKKVMADVDGCFHLAAIASVERSTTDWPGTSRVNLGGTVAVFDAAAHRHDGPVPVVYMSSAAVYGDVTPLPLVETGPVRPLSAYGADKLAGELHARIGGRLFGLKTFGLRPFNVFGPRQDPASPYSGVISIFCDRARRGAELALHGGGRQERDFVYVADAVRFLIAALPAAAATAPVANLCSGRPTTIASLAERIIDLADSPSAIRQAAARPGDILLSCGDPALARQLLGVEAETSLESGLRQLLG